MVYTVTDVIMGNYGSVTVLLLADVKCLRIGYVRYFRARSQWKSLVSRDVTKQIQSGTTLALRMVCLMCAVFL